MRLRSKKPRQKEEWALRRIAGSLARRGLVSEWHFGNHGKEGSDYQGEEDRCGRNGWKAAQTYFRDGANTALALLGMKRRSRLESPLWARGLGNSWESGSRNPWREREEDPLVYHWSRFVHLFSNQLGFDIEKEAELCSMQSERYSRAVKEFGMKWRPGRASGLGESRVVVPDPPLGIFDVVHLSRGDARVRSPGERPPDGRRQVVVAEEPPSGESGVFADYDGGKSRRPSGSLFPVHGRDGF